MPTAYDGNDLKCDHVNDVNDEIDDVSSNTSVHCSNMVRQLSSFLLSFLMNKIGIMLEFVINILTCTALHVYTHTDTRVCVVIVV